MTVSTIKSDDFRDSIFHQNQGGRVVKVDGGAGSYAPSSRLFGGLFAGTSAAALALSTMFAGTMLVVPTDTAMAGATCTTADDPDGVGGAASPDSGAEADGANSFACGTDSNASGSEALALGVNATASAARTIAIGSDAEASGSGSTAIGTSAMSRATQSIAIGSFVDIEATAEAAIGIGQFAVVKTEFGIAIGASANSDGIAAVALGQSAASSGENSVAVGERAQAEQDGSVALGSGAVAFEANSVALGADSVTSAAGGLAYGTQAAAPGSVVAVGDRRIQGVSDGFNATDAVNVAQLADQVNVIDGLLSSNSLVDANGNAVANPFTYEGGRADVQAVFDAIDTDIDMLQAAVPGAGDFVSDQVVGYVAPVASGDRASAGGDGAVASGEDSVAIGSSTAATDGRSVAVGSGSMASGSASVVIGSQSAAIGDDSVAIGQGTGALGIRAVAIGSGATADTESTALGNFAQANANVGDVALGADSVTGAVGGLAYGTQAAAPGSVVAVGNRRIQGLSDGVNATDAVNVAQLSDQADQLDAIIGSNSLIDANGNRTNGTVATVGGTNYTTVQSAIEAAAGLAGSGGGDFATSVVSTTAAAVASGDDASAGGDGAVASGNSSLALGDGAISSGVQSTAVGAGADAGSINGTAVGNFAEVNAAGGTALGNAAEANTIGSVALGQGSSASVNDGDVAIGSGSSTVTVGGAAYGTQTAAPASAAAFGDRRLQGVSGGVRATDAVNVGQLTDQVNVVDGLLSSNNLVDASGNAVANPFSYDSSNFADVQAVFDAIDADIGAGPGGAGDFRTSSVSAVAAPSVSGDDASAGGDGAVASGDRALALGAGATASGNDSIALGSGSTTGAVGGAAYGTQVAAPASVLAVGNRRIQGVADGVNASDAASVGQLASQASDINTLVGENVFDAAGNYTAPSFTTPNSTTANNIDDAFTGVTAQVDTNTTNINNINNGTAGLVRQASSGAPITVAAANNGTEVQFDGTAGTRTLSGLSDGAVNVASDEAVTGAQLFASNAAVSTALGGGANVTNGTNPTYNVGSTAVNNVGAAVDALDNKTDAAGNSLDTTIFGGDVAYNANTGAFTGGLDYTGRSAGTTIDDGSVQAVFDALGTDIGALAAAGGGDFTTDGTTGTAAQSDGADSSAGGNAAVATGDSSLAMGDGATAFDNGTIAIGEGAAAGNADAATTTAPDAIAIGTGARAFGSVALGAGASAAGGGTAIGDGALAGVAGGVPDGTNNNNAFGNTAVATGGNATAIGFGASASTNIGDVALGAGSVTGAVGGAAYGTQTAAPTSVVAVGERRIQGLSGGVNATDAVNVAQLSDQAGQFDALIGSNNLIDANGNLTNNTIATVDGTAYTTVQEAIEAAATVGGSGDFVTSTVSATVAAIASGDEASAGGDNAVASGFRSLALGNETVADGAAAIALGNLSSTSADFAIALGNAASVTGISGIAIGQGASSTGSGSALGLSASSTGGNAIAFGGFSSASGLSAVALGEQANASGSLTIAIGSSAVADQLSSVAIGAGSRTIASTNNSYGTGSAPGTGGVVAFGDGPLQRRIQGIAAGAEADEAVNVAQLSDQADQFDALLGAADLIDANGDRTGATIATVGTVAQTTVGGALNAQDTIVTSQGNTTASVLGGTSAYNAATGAVTGGFTYDSAGQTTVQAVFDEISTDITNINNGTAGLVQQAAAGAPITVGAATDGTEVQFDGTAGTRVLSGVSDGTVTAASDEAINGSQLASVTDNIDALVGSGNVLAGTLPSFTTPNGGTADDVTEAFQEVTTQTDTNTTNITNINNGTAGIVTQANNTAPVLVASGSDGTVVDFTNNSGVDRVLTGVADAVDADDAVTLGQAQAAADLGAAALGGGAALNVQDGSFTAPTFNVGNVAANTVFDAVEAADNKADQTGGDTATAFGGSSTYNPDTGVLVAGFTYDGNPITNVQNVFTEIEGDITNITNGTTGIVRQVGGAPGNGVITVGAQTGGTVVNMSGTDGDRRITGVANGTNANDAVTVGQAQAVADLGAAAIGGGAAVDVAAGAFIAPTLQSVNGGTTNNVADALSEISGQVDTNTTNITDNSTAITNLDNRVTTNETNIADNRTDIDQNTTDISNLDNRVTTNETNIATNTTNIADNRTDIDTNTTNIANNRGDIVNNTTNIADNRTDIDSNTTEINNIANGGGIKYFRADNTDAADAVASGENAIAAGQNAQALGTDSAAFGHNASAQGDNTTAVGAGATAFASTAVGAGSAAAGGGTAVGDNSRAGVDTNNMPDGTSNNNAFGNESVATGGNATALGYNTQATGENSTAVGNGSQATFANSTAVGAGAQTRMVDQVVLGTATSTITAQGVLQNGDVTSDRIVSINAEGDMRSVTVADITTQVAGNITVVGGSDTNVNGANVINILDGSITSIDIADGAINTRNIADNSVTYNKLGADVRNRFNELNDRDNRNTAGVALATAIANIPQLSQEGKFSIGAAFGAFNGEGGWAFGANGRFSENVVGRTSVGMTSQGDVAIGAGIAMEF